ncbi:MAG TPA: hypothetical protein VMW56_23280 [Candidatus Margulisiibacteriota bacterium]|nr:hypothetical protein [Candidatus Margulisiibacteriota bacterium]
MIYLFSVAAPARSGTQRLSRLFTMEHPFCYHELTTLLQPYPSNEALHDLFANSCRLWPDEVAALERSKQWLAGIQ